LSFYVCPKCGKKFSDEELEFIRCSYCGAKVLFKETPPVAKKFRTD